MRLSRFLVALIALVASVAVPASALLSCVADRNDAVMTQMACCKTAKPNCGTASKGTMECCKTGTHADEQNVAKVLTVANPLKTMFLSPASILVQLPRLARQPHEPVMLFAGTTSPPRFAFSALLI
jgi:hypothetical protein